MTAARIGASTLRTFAVRLRTSAPVSARILSELASKLDRGGPVADLLCSHSAVHSPLFGIQALAGVRLLMLSGKAPELSQRFASAHAETDYDLTFHVAARRRTDPPGARSQPAVVTWTANVYSVF